MLENKRVTKCQRQQHLKGSLKSIYNIPVPTWSLKVLHFLSVLKLETAIYQEKKFA